MIARPIKPGTDHGQRDADPGLLPSDTKVATATPRNTLGYCRPVSRHLPKIKNLLHKGNLLLSCNIWKRLNAM